MCIRDSFYSLTFNHKIMKNSKLFILGIAMVAVLTISCSKRNTLVNAWKITAVEPKMPLSDSLKSVILSDGTLTFTEDGHVTGFLTREITNGTYALTKGGKSLVIKDEAVSYTHLRAHETRIGISVWGLGW